MRELFCNVKKKYELQIIKTVNSHYYFHKQLSFFPLQLHPDSNPGDPEAQSNFVKLNEAYTHLSDPQKRLEHNQDIGIEYKPGERIHKDMFKHGRTQERSHHDMM